MEWRKLKADTEAETMEEHRFLPLGLFTYFLYTAQAHLSKDGTAYNRPSPPISVRN